MAKIINSGRMMSDQLISTENVRIDVVDHLSDHLSVDVLRLDLIHPVVSGNKWFKLKEYLEEARSLNKNIILTFGGAFSNHIVATAAVAKQKGFKSIGIIRGEKPSKLSPTLADAMDFGMELYFTSRKDYTNKQIPAEVFNNHSENDIYAINQGGYGRKGADGAKDILKHAGTKRYSHIMAAVGTGTTLAGLIEASEKNQKTAGISVLKNNYSLQHEIEALISENKRKCFDLIHDYHFGGFAKHTHQLFDFMNEWYRQTGIPSDFVYTGKLFFALNELVQKNYFQETDRILVIHSGGLQGNRSLPKGTLIF